MLPQEIIRRKRDGETLTDAEISAMVEGIADGSISEGQIAAFAMAVYFRGMSGDERVALTRAMTNSGRSIDWSDAALPRPLVDKHSTGGVGDKVSLMLAPLVAACGGYVPMISGRGLGHTGGTLDKLDSIPGYETAPDVETFRRVVRETGAAIIGQTADLAPADRRFYAVRDVTATVESIPLITASILSKKLAAGLDALVMDVKTGTGAFAASLEEARELAESIVQTSTGLGLPTTALITDMNQVLGRTAGNALEVGEAVAYLTNERKDDRLHEVVMALAQEMLVLGGLADEAATAGTRLGSVLASGRAAECFAQMVSALGGPVDFLENAGAHLPKAPIERPVFAEAAGVVTGMDVRTIGLAVVALGGGRRMASDGIDHAVGLSEVCGLGEHVGPGRPFAMVHAASDEAADAAADTVRQAIHVGDTAIAPPPLLHARIGGD